MIQRSKTLPLSLEFPLSQMHKLVNFPATCDRLMNESKRVREMTIAFMGSSPSEVAFARIIQSAKTHDFPVLSTLTLKSGTKYSFSSCRSVWFPGLKSLQTLKLVDILIPLGDVPHLPSLTSLIIYYYSKPDGLSFSRLARFLRRTPNIENIDCGNIYSEDVFTGPQIEIPKLRTLCLHFDSIKELRLLSYLDFERPAINSVSLSFGPPASYPDLSNLADFLRKLTVYHHPTSISRLRCTIRDGPQISFALFSHALGNPFLTVNIPLDKDAVRSYLQLFSILPLSHIPEFKFESLIIPSPSKSRLLELPGLILKEGASTSLRHLKLSAILVPPHMPQFLGLTKVSISNMTVAHQLSVTWITQFLRNTPNVEDLSLATILSINSTDASGPLRVILPTLKKLRIVSHSLAGAKLLDYLDFPQTTVCSVYSHPVKTIESTDFLPLQTLVERTSIVPGSQIARMRLFVTDYFVLELFRTDSDPKPFMKISLPWIKASTPLYHQLCSKLPLPHIRKLTISGISRRSTAFLWSPLIASFENLTELTLDGTIDEILDVLVQTTDQSSVSSNPNLRTIIDVNSKWDPYTIVTPADRLDIRDIFRKRREMGVPIERYIIRNGTIDKKMVGELRNVVQVELESTTM
ncbi:hypothetical protein ONZ45_g14887 [Pleurotus djamor]|nr:hypothetical protein ONZ45_g14887 [Pleurotus djamor]